MAEGNNKDVKPGLPDDAVLIKTSDPWFLYFSKSSNALFVETGNYHAGTLQLTKQELLGFIVSMETWSEEREMAALNQLKQNPELLAQMEILIERQKMQKG